MAILVWSTVSVLALPSDQSGLIHVRGQALVQVMYSSHDAGPAISFAAMCNQR